MARLQNFYALLLYEFYNKNTATRLTVPTIKIIAAFKFSHIINLTQNVAQSIECLLICKLFIYL